MKTILLTDLDGTILFSRRTLPEHLAVEQCFIAETYSNGGQGYLETALLAFFKEWTNEHQHLLIPVTTRSIAQFERLCGLWEELIPSFALVSNGGNLYCEGKLDPSWNQEVRQELAVALAQKYAVRAFLEAQLPVESVRKINEIDALYYCVLVTERAWEPAFVQALNRHLSQFGWIGFFQRKKLYFLPEALSKENAVARLRKKIGEERIYKGLGDTLMDQGMLQQCAHSLYFGTVDGEKSQQQPYSLDAIKKLLKES